MRTIGSTFSTREEAEKAGRDLEGLGVTPDRIILKDLAASGTEPALAGGASADPAAQGFFLSAKVYQDQITEATQILKGLPPGQAQSTAGRAAAAPRPAPRPLPDPRPSPEVHASTSPMNVERPPVVRTRPPEDWTAWGRRLILLALILLAGYIAGAALALLTK